jgi:hypothetical protein
MTDRASVAPRTVLATSRLGSLAVIWLPAFVLFGMGAVTDITLPGVYMDAVNPDYLIVLLLNPHHAPMSDWHLPGNLLFGIFPVMVQIYHGALPYYIGLPFYALFGSGVVGIRLANMVFGLLVLAGAGFFMRAFHVRTAIAAICLALLALDPGFLFSFRTQFYITLLPVAAALTSAAVIEHNSRAPSRGSAAISGLLAGIACYGYFIYGFLVPAVALFAILRWRRLPAARGLVIGWIAGFAIGVMPYAIGFLLIMISTGGPRGFIAYILASFRAQNAGGASLPLWQAWRDYVGYVDNTIAGVGPALMMFQKVVALEIPRLKQAALLIVPAIALISGVFRPSRIRGLLVLLGMLAGFFVLVVVFGGRLWLHHAALLLPLLYTALALALERIASVLAPRHSVAASLVIACAAAPFLIANAADRQAFFLDLDATGGIKLASDAIDRYAEDSLHDAPGAYRFFPDWGVFMSFAMITRGSVPYAADFSPAAARTVLCGGQDAELVMVAGQPEARLQDWLTAVGWSKYDRSRYDQRDGTPVLDIVHWHAADKPQGVCP